MSSSIGKIFKLTTFGESHGVAIGGIVEGCPAGLKIDLDYIQNQLDKRRPGSSSIFSSRSEPDKVEILSGLFEGVTLGTPIGFLIRNHDQKSEDYNLLKDVFRPSHADFSYQKKYGVRDYRGGGRSSARETANWIVGGAIASQILSLKGIELYSYVKSIGGITLNDNYNDLNLEKIYNNDVRCPSDKVASKMRKLINLCKENGDTIGGEVFTVLRGVPAGLGSPVFNKLHSALSQAIMSINACKGVEFGSGFSGIKNKGSEENDVFVSDFDSVKTLTNNSGGVQGGISNGQDIYFKSGFKPVSTLMKKQRTIDSKLNKVDLKASGRHDPCVLPRVVPVVDAVSALVLLDQYLLNKTIKLSDI